MDNDRIDEAEKRITAPLAEEIFFRGFIFGGLRRYMNLATAGAISGFLFALAHGDPGLILPFWGIGRSLRPAW